MQEQSENQEMKSGQVGHSFDYLFASFFLTLFQHFTHKLIGHIDKIQF